MDMSNDKKEVQDDVEVCILPRQDSFKPLVIPPSSQSITAAKRRWSLIKTATKVRRQSSITLKEHRLLKSICSSISSSVLDKDEEKEEIPLEDPAHDARRRLRNSISRHSLMMTDAETSFLTELAELPDMTPEELDVCSSVLENDPLYNHNSTTQQQQVETSKTERRPSMVSNPSFRKEVWKHLQAEEQTDSTQTLLLTSPTSVAAHREEVVVDSFQEPQDDDKPAESKRRGKWQSFVYKFQKALNLDERDDKSDDTGEETLEEEDLGQHSPTFCVLATSIEHFTELPMVMSPPIMDALRDHLPFAVQHDNFWLKYSMARDGASQCVLAHNVRSSARTIVAIETDQGDVFGSFTSSPWRMRSDGYYGSCEAFLWRLKRSRYTPCSTVEEQVELETDLEVFHWTGSNRNIQSWSGSKGELLVGGGGCDDGTDSPDKDYGVGFSVNEDMTRGFSDRCITFDSPPLMTKNARDCVFTIANMEVWTLTPVEDLDEAEKLELSRQFVFDHGGFVEH